MPVRVRYSIKAVISSTTAEEKDLGNQSWEVMTDTQGEGGAWKVLIPKTSTDLQVPLGSVAAAKLVVLRTLSKDPTLALPDITIKKNANNGEAIVIRPLGDQKEGHFLLSTSGITALYVTNPSATVDVEMVVVVVGD